jgi:hypothetical protein
MATTLQFTSSDPLDAGTVIDGGGYGITVNNNTNVIVESTFEDNSCRMGTTPSNGRAYLESEQGSNFNIVRAEGNRCFVYSTDGDNEGYLKVTPTAALLNIRNIEKTVVSVRAVDNFADDSAAATGGVAVGEFYHTSGVVKMRLA